MLPRLTSALAHTGGALRIGSIEMGKAVFETQHVELVNGEDAYATRSASRLTDEPVSAAAFGVKERGIDDLNQFLSCGGSWHGIA